MLKIGEFSKLCQMTVKALRFYEKEGLLIPASVDEWTGYRFYTTDQLRRAEKIVYYTEKRLEKYSDMMHVIPAIGEEFKKLNPNLKCAEPPYEFCEYPDGEYRENNVLIRHVEAVTDFGQESENIKFKKLPAVKVLSIFHKGAYDQIGEAYAFIMKYAEENGYKIAGLSRECYIDGIWNKDSVDDWLTEIQLPIE